MSLVRFLPTPSDRMGIIWSLLAIQDSVVLEYGPAGTTHYSMGLYGSLGLRFQNRLFTTHLSEDDVVMGDVSRLEESILEIDKVYQPKVIFVVASSTTAVIGTDIKGVCKYMQKEVQAKLISFEQGGFRGDYSVGLLETYKLLVKNIVKPAEKKKGTYNLIGASAWRYRMSSDIWEVKSLLKEALNLECSACLCDNTSVEEIQSMSGAELNIVLGNEGLAAAKLLQEKFGTPYIYKIPYGYQGTIDFLEAVGTILNITPNPLVTMRLKMKIKGMSMLFMYSMMGGGKIRPFFAIRGDYDMVKGVSTFLEAANIKPVLKLCAHSLKAIENADSSIQFCKTEKEWLNLIAPLQKTLVLADDIALNQCENSNTKLRIAAPYLKGGVVATHLPFMGEKGADFLMEKITEYYQSF